jgi:hypothetical protein
MASVKYVLLEGVIDALCSGAFHRGERWWATVGNLIEAMCLDKEIFDDALELISSRAKHPTDTDNVVGFSISEAVATALREEHYKQWSYAPEIAKEDCIGLLDELAKQQARATRTRVRTVQPWFA